MDTFIVIIGVAAIVGGVVAWHIYGKRVIARIKGRGPIEQPQDSLSMLADKMHAAKADFHVYASKLESKLTTAKADVEATTAKVVAAAAPKVQP